MKYALHLRVTGESHLVKAHGAHLLKRRLQSCQTFEGGVGLDEFVLGQNGLAQAVFDRHDRAVKVACDLRRCSSLLRFQRKGIHICTGKALQRGDQVCAYPLGHKSRLRIGFRVHSPCATVRANGHSAHAFHATGHYQVFPARTHLLRRHIHCF